MADIKTQILLELGIKGDTNVATRINKIIESQFKLGDTAKATEAQQASLADAFKKTDFALRGLGKGAKDAGIDSDILSQALKGNKIAIGQVKRELADYTQKEKQAAAIRKQSKKSVEGLKLELRHYGVKVKQVTGWERLRKQALKGNVTAQKLLRKEVNKAIQTQKKQKQSLMDSIFGFRNLRNETEGSTMAFSVFRSKLLLASFAMGMYARTVGKFIALADEQHRAEAQVGRAILTTGFAAGQTSSSIIALGNEMQRLTGIADSLIIKSSAVLLTFTNISGAAFPRAMKVAVDLSKAFDKDLKQSVIQVGKALNDPVLGLTALRDSGVSFNETQKKSIKGFMAINDIASAQKVIFDELEKEIGGVAEAMSKTPLERFNKSMADLGDIGETVGDGFARMFSPLQSVFEVLLRWTKEDIEFIGKLVGKQQIQEFESRTEAVKAGIDGVRALIVDAGSEARKSEFFESVISEDFVSQLKMMKLEALNTEEGFKKFIEMIVKSRLAINTATDDYNKHKEEVAELKEASDKVTKSYEDQLAIAMQTTEADKAKMKEALKLGVAMKDLDPSIVQVIDSWFTYKDAVEESNEAQKNMNKLLDSTISAQKEKLEMDLFLIKSELAKQEAMADLEQVSIDTSRYTDAIAKLEKQLADLNKPSKEQQDIINGLTDIWNKSTEAQIAAIDAQLLNLLLSKEFTTEQETYIRNQLLAQKADLTRVESLTKMEEAMLALTSTMKGFGGVMDFSAFEALDFNAESQKEALEQGVVARESFYTQLGEMSLEHHANELAKEEEKIRATGERELEQLRNSRAYKFMSDKKKLEEEKKITDATNKELKENFNKKQRIAYSQIAIDTARAVMGIWAETPKFDFGISAAALTAMVIGMGAAQAAIVGQQKAPSFAQGGDFVVPPGFPNDSFPMNVESGERVQITPKSGVGGAAPSQATVNVSFAGNVLSQDFIEDEAIPMIKEAIRRGADIGVA